MGRILKRVPLDFNWPINQIWKGYWNPYSGMKCKSCDGSGYSSEAKKYLDDWYALNNANYQELPNGRRYNANAHYNHLTQLEVDALLAKNRLRDLTRDGHIPTVEEVNEWSKNVTLCHGHDSINQWICCEAVMKSRGVDTKCPICHGSGDLWFSEEIEKKADEWYEKERYDPPEGEGWQLWETTSEGSPITPVFKTAEELAEYCAKTCTVFADFMHSKEEWLEDFLGGNRIVHQQENAMLL
jgi:hypothetical protein